MVCVTGVIPSLVTLMSGLAVDELTDERRVFIFGGGEGKSFSQFCLFAGVAVVLKFCNQRVYYIFQVDVPEASARQELRTALMQIKSC